MRARNATILALVLLTGCGGPPSIGPDRDTFKAVDALYTAVSLRDEKLVARCETALVSLRDAGKLPKDASDSLASIITEAKSKGWENAQTRLATFMEGQRR